MTTMFFPVELIQMLGLRVMLTNKTWALAWLISTGRLELGSIELEHIALHVLSLHGVLLSLPFPQEHGSYKETISKFTHWNEIQTLQVVLALVSIFCTEATYMENKLFPLEIVPFILSKCHTGEYACSVG